jgi:hypothetical protein
MKQLSLKRIIEHREIEVKIKNKKLTPLQRINNCEHFFFLLYDKNGKTQEKCHKCKYIRSTNLGFKSK